MKNENLNKLVLASLFTALTCLFTMVIRVPSFGPGGYVNIGDTGVLLSAWMLGGSYGALAAGIGSGLADLLSGYPIYIPGTFVIKLLMAVAASFLMKKMSKTAIPRPVSFITTGVAAEIVMVAGYLLYEALFLGYGAAALPAVVSNMFQAISNLILSVLLVMVLEKGRAFTAMSAK